MAAQTITSKYPMCDDIPQTKLNVEATPELMTYISENYRTLPMYEKSVFDYQSKKRYSLETNKQLACRWQECKQTLIERVKEPFHIIDSKDYHFYLGTVQYAASETTARRKTFRMKMKLGPGKDEVGVLPLTTEAIYRERTKHVHRQSAQKNRGKKNLGAK